MTRSFFRISDRQVRYAITAFALIVATIAPALAPGLVSAAQLTERSIALSNSSASATGVTYSVNFTAVADAGAFVVDFCSNSPIVGSTCTSPTTNGFSASAAASTTAGFTDVTALDGNTIVVAGDIDVSTEDEVSVDITGINNPTVSGPLYARIVTYDADTNADLYTSTSIDDAHAIDDGGVAIEITDTIGVSGAVLETLSFCVAGIAIEADCDIDTGNPNAAPVLQLGEQVGDVVALTPGAVSTGVIHTQISTNAVSGAVVSLKSSAANCGGLVRAGAPTSCDIAPALTGGIVDGQARFGVMTAAATNATGALTPSGTYAPVTDSGYSNSAYALNYAANQLTGVTSAFGDPFLDTAGAPVNNKNMALTFGASISNDTPAGLYSTNISLIATGRF